MLHDVETFLPPIINLIQVVSCQKIIGKFFALFDHSLSSIGIKYCRMRINIPIDSTIILLPASHNLKKRIRYQNDN